MGLKQFVSRVAGITFGYAKNHMYEYHVGDFIELIPEPTNPYDRNAIAIYDINKNLIGHVSKDYNRGILDVLSSFRYIAYISQVYSSFSTPSIEYVIIYDNPEMISNQVNINFNFEYNKYISTFKKTIEDENDDIFDDIKIKDYEPNKKEKIEEDDVSFTSALELYNNQRFSSAYTMLKKLEVNEDSNVLLFIGLCLLDGKGIDKNREEAYNYFLKSSYKHNPYGTYYRAYCLENGYGVIQDADEAVCLYNGIRFIPDALFRLGSIYINGSGVPQNVEYGLNFIFEGSLLRDSNAEAMQNE